MRTIKVVIQFDGSDWFGFQRQKTVKTVQQEIEAVLKKATGVEKKIKYAGRTDRGVHAKRQVFSYSDEGKIPIEKMDSILSKGLSAGFRVVSVETVRANFDPRRDATFREYEYWIYKGSINPFLDKYMLGVDNINEPLIRRCMPIFIGDRDCSILCANPRQYKGTIRKIIRFSITKENYSFLSYKGECFKLVIRANGFLQHMVRKIIGLILEVNSGLISIGMLKSIIDYKEEHSWAPAPAKALFLSQVGYEEQREVYDEK